MIKAILFDLGKVILDFNFEPAFHRLAKFAPLSAKDIEDYFWKSELEVLYDGGKITSLEFHKEVKRALKHSLSYEAFRSVWNNIFTPKKEIVSLIRRLSPRYRLVLISNTNAMHYDHVRKRYAILDRFDRSILSFKEKTRKPDERIYKIAAKACLAEPREIFYIDDRKELTEAAESFGFHVFTYKNNPAQLIRKMKDLRIL